MTQETRAAQAQQHAAAIAARAAALSTADKEIAAKIATTTAELAQPSFSEFPWTTRTVQAVHFKQAPPPPAYPVYEVIGEATDLDGNHVVLRRGYYDEATEKGFGWDKAYWRHHVVNPNVFKDLISHSRPTSNKDGTLVYEVPMNRAHCKTGLLGIVDCEDSGESLTMRIVAKVTEGRLIFSYGAQKGVISMYPLAGGSGVVEVEKDWTLTPPWVNNNVPIN